MSGTLVLILLAAATAGCVNQTREVAIYRTVLDDHLPKPEPLQPGQELTLGRALALANHDNEQLASQGENYVQTVIAKHRAFASFLPTVSFQPNFTVEEAPRGAGANASPGAPSANAASVAASQGGYAHSGHVLYRVEAPVVGQMTLTYRDIPLYRAAKLVEVEQRQELRDAQATLMLNVAENYFQVLTSIRQAAVLRHSMALQQARVRDLQGRVRARLSLPLDLAQAEAAEAATEVSLRHAENDIRNGRRTLALLIGAPEVSGMIADGVVRAEAPPAAVELVKRALATRQDYLAAQAAVGAARYAVKAAVAEYYPSVSLSAAGFLYRQDYANASRWDSILVANVPIFSAGQIRADVRTAWSRLRQAGLLESYLRRSITQNVETARDNLATSGVILDDLRREVDAAKAAYVRAEQLEKLGLSIPLDVLTAQDTLQNAELQYASQAYAETIFRFDLLRATGELTPDTPEKLTWAHLAPPS